MDTTHLVLALAGLLIGVMKAGFGGGVGVVVTPLLALVMPAKLALGVMLPLSLAADLIAIKYYWKYRVSRFVFALIPGMAVGVLVGWVLLDAIPELWFRRMLGGLACVFGLLQAFKDRLPKVPPVSGVAAGVALGVVSVLTHSGGIILMLYLMPQGLSVRVFVSTAVVVGLVLNTMKSPAYANLGLLGPEVWLMDLWMLPTLAAGVGVGILMNRRLPVVWFNRAILTLVLVIGVRLMMS